MAKRSRCECGKVRRKYAHRCDACERERNEKRIAEAQAIVSTGICPQCGAPLKRNLAMTGWWQCEQYGADTHRADPSKPACSFWTSVA